MNNKLIFFTKLNASYFWMDTLLVKSSYLGEVRSEYSVEFNKYKCFPKAG